jgi:hypothetical protein
LFTGSAGILPAIFLVHGNAHAGKDAGAPSFDAR